MLYALEKEDLKKILNYLLARPYNEVVNFIDIIQKSKTVNVISEDSDLDEKDKNGSS